MATPVFKFNHPDYKFDLYIIHNTYSELPETIPMDLTTFFIYHIKSGRTFSGLLMCWEDLNTTGSSLYDTTFDEFYTNDEKVMLYDLAIDSGAIRCAKENEVLSDKIKSFIDNKLYESQSFSDFIEETASLAIDNFRPLNYYKSIHDLFLFIEKQNKNLFSGKKFYPNDPFEDVVENFDDDLPF
jgi:hypothetical protein